MNNSAVNFTTETSTNYTTHFISLVDHMDICVLSFNVLLGFPTHFYVIWLIITGTGNGISMEFFTLNLSVCEIGICLTCVFFLFVYCPCPNLSALTNFFLGLGITGRPVFQCLICVERYLAVVYPVTFLKLKPLRYRLMCSAVAWIITLSSCLVYGFNLVVVNTFSKIWFYSMQFLIFLLIQFFCLSAVLRALKQSGPGERGREREEENHMKRRAFHLILITTVSMGIIYVPFIFLGIVCIIKQDFLWEPFIIALISFVFAGFVHPVLYLHRTGKLTCFCSP